MSELDSARRLIGRGKPEQAARLLAERIGEHPNDKEAWLLMAKAVKEPQQKLDCFQRALEIDPKDISAKKGIEEINRHLRLTGVKKKIGQPRSKQARYRRTKAEKSSIAPSLQKILKTKYILPAIFFILVSAIVFLVLKNRPGSKDILQTTPAALSSSAPTPSQKSTIIPTEDSNKVFIPLPFNIYYSQEGKLWVWQDNISKSLADIDTSTSVVANQQAGFVLFIHNGDLWQVKSENPLPKVFASSRFSQQETPPPTSSTDIITAAGIIPSTNQILMSIMPGELASTSPEQAALFSAQSDGSEVKQLLKPGEGGVPYPSPDGKGLAVISSSSVRLLSPINGSVLNVLDFVPIPTDNRYMLPTPQWAKDSSWLQVAIPAFDFINDLNAPTTIWQITIKGQKTALASIQNRGGTILFSANLQSMIYQLNLSSVNDYFGEIHRAIIDGSQDTVLFDGQLAHLIGLDAMGDRVVFQFQDSPNSIQLEDASAAGSRVILDKMDADIVRSMTWMDEQTFLYQTTQNDTTRLWLAKFDGIPHSPLALAENPDGGEILYCFTKK